MCCVVVYIPCPTLNACTTYSCGYFNSFILLRVPTTKWTYIVHPLSFHSPHLRVVYRRGFERFNEIYKKKTTCHSAVQILCPINYSYKDWVIILIPCLASRSLTQLLSCGWQMRVEDGEASSHGNTLDHTSDFSMGQKVLSSVFAKEHLY